MQTSAGIVDRADVWKSSDNDQVFPIGMRMAVVAAVVVLFMSPISTIFSGQTAFLDL
jgi:enoyl-[acyl-carrier-protein] reductase (NADH)